MKTTFFRITLVLGLQLSLAASAQQVVNLRVPNFARGLVEKWVAEYQKTTVSTNGSTPALDFQFVSGKSQTTGRTISLTTNGDGVLVARYAVLPVTEKGSEAEHLVGVHALNAKSLKRLFFVEDELDDEEKVSKLEQQLHIVTGNNHLSASRLYAAHFHRETSDYRGKKIQGDDTFLNHAISLDPLSVTVNSLSNIFDLESRQLLPALALLPLDIDKKGRQTLGEGRLDDIILLLEQEEYREIPVGHIGLEYDHNDHTLNDFARWVLQQGVAYVHQYGMLALPQKQLVVQQQRVVRKDLAINKKGEN